MSTFLDRFLSTAETVVNTASKIDFNKPFESSISRVAVYSKASPPFVYTGADIQKMANGLRVQARPVQVRVGAGNTTTIEEVPAQAAKKPTFLEWAKPTLRIESPVFGNKTLAPYGEASPADWDKTKLKLKLMVVGVLGVAFVGGMAFEHWRAKRR
jgi:hypothetical protein